jgi:hypothetical protein
MCIQRKNKNEQFVVEGLQKDRHKQPLQTTDKAAEASNSGRNNKNSSDNVIIVPATALTKM